MMRTSKFEDARERKRRKVEIRRLRKELGVLKRQMRYKNRVYEKIQRLADAVERQMRDSLRLADAVERVVAQGGRTCF